MFVRLVAIKTTQCDQVLFMKKANKTEPTIFNLKDVEGHTPLIRAAMKGDNAEIDRLIKKGADPTIGSAALNSLPIHFAAEAGHYSTVVKLLEYAPDTLNLMNNTGYSVLHYAVCSRPENVEVQKNKMAIIEYLFEKKADFHITDKSENTALHVAATVQDNAELINSLLEKGADPNNQNESLITPLICAIRYNNLQSAEALIKKRAGLEVGEREGNAPLHWAVLYNLKEACELLIRYKANINVKNSQNLMPVHYAIRLKHDDVFAYLIEKGAKINTEQSIQFRQLALVFNHEKINASLESIDNINYTDFTVRDEPIYSIYKFLSDFLQILGGKDLSSYQFILRLLAELINQNNGKAANISNAMPTANQNKIVKIIKTGYKGHDFYVYEKCTDAGDEFVFAERGALTQFSWLQNIKREKQGLLNLQSICSPLVKLKFASEKRGEVLEKLAEAKKSSEQKAIQILFQELPAWTHHKRYEVLEVEQKCFKNGRCGFENLKSLLLGLFIEVSSINEGKLLYKEFDLYMHEKALEEFKIYLKNSPQEQNAHSEIYNEIIKTCEANIASKEEKLKSLQASMSLNPLEKLKSFLSVLRKN